MTFCGKCGAQFKEGNMFCTSCGTAVKSVETQKTASSTHVRQSTNNYINSMPESLKQKSNQRTVRTVVTLIITFAVIIGAYILMFSVFSKNNPDFASPEDMGFVKKILASWIIGLLLAIPLMVYVKKKRFAALSAALTIADKYPTLWKYFGVKNTMLATPLQPILFERELYRELPSEMKGSEPKIIITPDFVLGTLYVSEKFGEPEEHAMNYLEEGAKIKTIVGGCIVMSEKLGLANGRNYARLVQINNELQKVADSGDYSMWKYLQALTDLNGLDMNLIHYFDDQLKLICTALRLDWDSTGLGEYDPGKTTYFGWGSTGFVATLGLLNIAESGKRSMKMHQFGRASTYFSYNNIAAYFNEKYFPREYAQWLVEQSPETVRL